MLCRFLDPSLGNRMRVALKIHFLRLLAPSLATSDVIYIECKIHFVVAIELDVILQMSVSNNVK